MSASTDSLIAIEERLDHEVIHAVRGRRSGLAITIALHDTRLGPGLGGCRLWRYDDWAASMADAMRLARGMTSKNALAGLSAGGGKTVVQAPDSVLDTARRRDVFLDVGDAVEDLGGSYFVAEDVGTTSSDMLAVAERTSQVVGLPVDHGGSGDPAPFTARGVQAALESTLTWLDGSSRLADRRVVIVGCGQVGSALVSQLVRSGTTVFATDINPARRAFVESQGATWCDPADAYGVECDVFMPAGVGGMLTSHVIDALATRAVVGPANNQLADPGGAEQLAARGIVYAPDFLVNAGGVIMLKLAAEGKPPESIAKRIDAIGGTLTRLLDEARSLNITTLRAAEREVQRRLSSVGPHQASSN